LKLALIRLSFRASVEAWELDGVTLMKMYRIGLLAITLTSAAALASANAADMYRAPEPVAGGYKDVPVASWTGFYAGVNGGGAWSEFSDQLANFANVGAFSGLKPSGGFGGGQIGYNWQGVWHPHLVLGVEADIQGAGIEDKATFVPSSPPLITAVSESRVDWFGTVRGRLGYAFDGALAYATGGFAYGHVHNSQADSRGVTFLFDGTATGYAVGGGLEYKLSPAWSVKTEYQFIDLGKNDPISATQGSFTAFNTKLEDDAFHTVRAGLNYHIGSGYVPLK
jgi:outer membrane immunogenic protein